MTGTVIVFVMLVFLLLSRLLENSHHAIHCQLIFILELVPLRVKLDARLIGQLKRLNIFYCPIFLLDKTNLLQGLKKAK